MNKRVCDRWDGAFAAKVTDGQGYKELQTRGRKQDEQAVVKRLDRRKGDGEEREERNGNGGVDDATRRRDICSLADEGCQGGGGEPAWIFCVMAQPKPPGAGCFGQVVNYGGEALVSSTCKWSGYGGAWGRISR